MQETIDEEVKRIIDECYLKARTLIQEYHDVLDACARLLLEKEKITRSEFEALLRTARLRRLDFMNIDALFCDGTQDYVIPAEPKENEKIILKFRTAHNDVEEVNILTEDRSYAMWKISSGNEFD